MGETESTFDELVAAWLDAMTGARALAGDPAAWDVTTRCPGWTIGDIVAHLVDIDSFLLGLEPLDHTPDWASLPHADSPVGRLTEVGVDARRARSQDDVLAEFDAVVPRRAAQLAEGPHDLSAMVMGPFGSDRPLRRVLTMRTLDAWLHELDIRQALGLPDRLDCAAGRITAGHLLSSLTAIWAKAAAAPIGTTLEVRVTGPVIALTLQVTVDEQGRGVEISGADPDLTLTASWPDLLDLMSGRLASDDPAVAERVTLTGETALGTRVLTSLKVVP